MPKIVDHEARREHIAQIVADMLATVGVEQTTIREISRQSGYSRGFIEHYFHSKEELISDALKWINEKSLERIEKRLTNLHGLGALRALNEVTLPLNEQTRREWKVRMQFWGLAAVNPKHKKEQTRRIHLAEKIYLKYLEEAQQMGEIEAGVDLTPMAHSLLHRIYGLSCNAILRPNYFTRKVQLQALDHVMSEIVKAR
jgi:AcrR family transcriptional regulator